MCFSCCVVYILQAVDNDNMAAMLSFEIKGVGTAPPNLQ